MFKKRSSFDSFWLNNTKLFWTYSLLWLLTVERLSFVSFMTRGNLYQLPLDCSLVLLRYIRLTSYHKRNNNTKQLTVPTITPVRDTKFWCSKLHAMESKITNWYVVKGHNIESRLSNTFTRKLRNRKSIHCHLNTSWLQSDIMFNWFLIQTS